MGVWDIGKDFLCPAVNYIGTGTVKVTGERVKILGGTKALIVCDPFLAKLAGGPVEKVVASLKESGIDYAIFADVHPNPRDTDVAAGFDAYKKANADILVSVGGGSAHDCAKGIGIAATHPGKLIDYAGIEELTNATIPLVAVNTTAGTGSEVTRHCVITDTSTKIKFVIVSWRNLPLVSINDPELHLMKPPGLTAATGMDALTHAVECYVTLAANPTTDAVAAGAIKLISNNLRRAVSYGQDIEARTNMAHASVLAGMAFNNAGLGYVHAMAHQLGGLLDMAHGVANAILLPHVERWNLPCNLKKFGEIAEMMGENIQGLSPSAAANKAIDAIVQLSEDVGIPSGLRQLGVKDEDLAPMAKQAMLDGNAGCNPRVGTEKDLLQIFQAAM
ncbi:MAG: iron-containing alcohol dehydrogenase [Dehalobacter sp.]|nr:iron-containing alcohol dehydrogenase [Dehalobacter sp.]